AAPGGPRAGGSGAGTLVHNPAGGAPTGAAGMAHRRMVIRSEDGGGGSSLAASQRTGASFTAARAATRDGAREVSKATWPERSAAAQAAEQRRANSTASTR